MASPILGDRCRVVSGTGRFSSPLAAGTFERQTDPNKKWPAEFPPRVYQCKVQSNTKRRTLHRNRSTFGGNRPPKVDSE
jgi:hypothetical protein